MANQRKMTRDEMITSLIEEFSEEWAQDENVDELDDNELAHFCLSNGIDTVVHKEFEKD